MRELFSVPIYIDQYTSFTVIDTPVIVLFSDLISKLKNRSFKISLKKYKIYLFYVDIYYSCYMTIEIFSSYNGNLMVECLRRDGSRQLFHQIFQWIQFAPLQPSIYIKPEKEIFIAIINQIDELCTYFDIEKQLYEMIAIHCKKEFLSEINSKKFKIGLTNMLQSNEIDLLRWGCLILNEIKDFFEIEIKEWKSLLCMQYQLLSPHSIFTDDLLKRIPICLSEVKNEI